MLQDQSIDKIETMNFLERHLGDFQTTGSVRPSVKKTTYSLPNLLKHSFHLLQVSQALSDTAQLASGLLTVVRITKKSISYVDCFLSFRFVQ
jgi:hypothetical protein